MNKTLLAIGGGVIIASGLLYWYLTQKPTPSPPPPPPPSGCAGPCYYEGALDCDRDNNLCKCVGGEWVLLERNSPTCLSGVRHNECFPSIPGNISTCIPVPGEGIDVCDKLGFSEGCSCVIGDCDVFHFCEPRDLRCIEKAVNVLVEGSNPGSSHWLEIPLDASMAATNLGFAKIWYKWAGIVDVINWSVWGRYQGIDTLLMDGWYSSWGDTGWFWVPSPGSICTFPAQGIDMIRVHCDSAISNVIPDMFSGKLNW